jgi:hypothetical protein
VYNAGTLSGRRIGSWAGQISLAEKLFVMCALSVEPPVLGMCMKNQRPRSISRRRTTFEA